MMRMKLCLHCLFCAISFNLIYSFDHGPVHFVILDDVEWSGKNNRYKGGLDEDQLTFVKNDLALVPEEKLVVLMMHIPLTNVGNRQKLYRLIEKRPYTMSRC